MLIAVNFHYIREQFDLPYPSIFGITLEAFQRQLETLGKWGSFVSQHDIVQSLQGKSSLPERAFVITFDDGLKEQYELALPILKKMGIPAIFFVNPRVFEEEHVLGVHKIHQLRSVVAPAVLMEKTEAYLRAKDRGHELGTYQDKAVNHYRYDKAEIAKLKYLLNFVLNISERQELIDSAFLETFGTERTVNRSLYMEMEHLKELHLLGLLGSHSYEHFPIGTLEFKDQEIQVRRSQEFFKRELGAALSSFSYPYGAYEACEGLEDLLKENEFQFGFTMERAINTDLQNPFYLSRFDNNDLPLGKAWKGPIENPFHVLPAAKWKFSS
jgi:peptidoglycan/xylan/chitin deacetylase (PgdA/CDA1 family)